jgi:DNA polymerase III epsilon subunit-like protein
VRLPPIPLVVLDTETTGFIPRVNRVIEFASARIEDGKVIDEFEQLIKIPTEIPSQVVTLTRIRPESLQDQPTMDDVRDAITAHIGQDAIIVGQNVGFDLRMLKGEGIDLTDRPWIDTSMLASVVFPELESYSLSYVSGVLDLEHTPVHRALGDVRATIALLSRCWERLEEITPELEAPLRAIMERAPEGYRRLFAALPKATAKKNPRWLRMPALPTREKRKEVYAMTIPDTGTVQLIEEPLDAGFLASVARGAAATNRPHVLAVKNLHATLRAGELPADIGIVQPAPFLLDPVLAAKFAVQERYTADESTLALKLAWYEPHTLEDVPIHGEERAVWGGKLACTDDSAAFRGQFTSHEPVTVLNHRLLLEIVMNPDHPGQALLTAETHVVIDDASMLEDTATRTYGWHCALDDLRAAAEGDGTLTSLTDLLQLWMEKTRAMRDVHYLSKNDVQTAEAKQLGGQIDTALEDETIPAHIRRMLQSVRGWMASAPKDEWITWIETRQNGSQFLESAPDRVGPLLKAQLYDRMPVTLLVPPKSADHLQEIVPRETHTSVAPALTAAPLALHFLGETSTEQFVLTPLPGKTVLLMGSRARIEDTFVRFAESAEEKGVTLICQGLSGGMGRMQAEFCAASAPAVWVLTPWSFEGAELVPDVIDHLVVESLPFDHPASPVFSKRSEHYQDSFSGYSLPRLRHRLHRMLRTFCKYATQDHDARFLDTRLEAKEYGRKTWEYLRMITGSSADQSKPETPVPSKVPRAKKASKPAAAPGQPSLF